MLDQLGRDVLGQVAWDRESDAGRGASQLGIHGGERVGIPTTCPSRSTSAPPLLPGLIGALVWITFGSEAPPGSVTVRPTALTIPSVTLLCSPSGLPMAITMSPTTSFEESPKVAG